MGQALKGKATPPIANGTNGAERQRGDDVEAAYDRLSRRACFCKSP